jgi:hypothetical protein
MPDTSPVPFKPALSGTTCPVLAGFAIPASLPVPDRLPVWSLVRFDSPETALTPVLIEGPGRPPPHAS